MKKITLFLLSLFAYLGAMAEITIEDGAYIKVKNGDYYLTANLTTLSATTSTDDPISIWQLQDSDGGYILYNPILESYAAGKANEGNWFAVVKKKEWAGKYSITENADDNTYTLKAGSYNLSISSDGKIVPTTDSNTSCTLEELNDLGKLQMAFAPYAEFYWTKDGIGYQADNDAHTEALINAQNLITSKSTNSKEIADAIDAIKDLSFTRQPNKFSGYFLLKSGDKFAYADAITSNTTAETISSGDLEEASRKIVLTNDEVQKVKALFTLKVVGDNYYLVHANSGTCVGEANDRVNEIDITNQEWASPYRFAKLSDETWALRSIVQTGSSNYDSKRDYYVAINTDGFVGTPTKPTSKGVSIEEVKNFTVKMNAIGDKTYATAHFPFPVQLTTNNAVTYVSTQEPNAAKDKIILKSTSEVPANTGMLIVNNDKGESVTFSILDKEVKNPEITKDLTGKNIQTLFSTTVGQGNYGLDKKEDDQSKPIFYQFSDVKTTTLRANRAYIHTEAKLGAIKLSLDGVDVTTDIVNALINDTTELSDAPIYDLSGRRVTKATKGIYIQNGKKFIK